MLTTLYVIDAHCSYMCVCLRERERERERAKETERERVCVCASLQRRLYYSVPLKDCTETAVSLLTETDATNSLARPEGSERAKERERE